MTNNELIKLNVRDYADPKDPNDHQFKWFLRAIEAVNLPCIETANGIKTIQQTVRNDLRKQGLACLIADLKMLYGDEFDIVETKEGIVVVAETDDFTFSWEIKSTIKAIDYDPFLEAAKWEDAQALKVAKKANAVGE